MGRVVPFDPDTRITVISIKAKDRHRTDVWFLDIDSEVWKVTLRPGR